MDEENIREIIESEILVLIGIKDTTYDYNDEFWDSIWTIFTSVLSYKWMLLLSTIFIRITSSPRKYWSVCIQGIKIFSFL